MPAVVNTSNLGNREKGKRGYYEAAALDTAKLLFVVNFSRFNINSENIRGSRSSNVLFPRQHAAPVCVVYRDDRAGLFANARDGRVICGNCAGHRD